MKYFNSFLLTCLICQHWIRYYCTHPHASTHSHESWTVQLKRSLVGPHFLLLCKAIFTANHKFPLILFNAEHTQLIPISVNAPRATAVNPFLHWCDLWQRGSLLWSLCVHVSTQPSHSEWVMTGTDKRAVNISWREIKKRQPTPSSSSPLGPGCTGIWLPGNTDQTSPTSHRWQWVFNTEGYSHLLTSTWV